MKTQYSRKKSKTTVKRKSTPISKEKKLSSEIASFEVGQSVVWVHSRTKEEKIAKVLKIKNKIQVESDDQTFWVAAKSLRVYDPSVYVPKIEIFYVGQKVLWRRNGNKEEQKLVTVLRVKNKIQIQSEDQILWVSPKNLRRQPKSAEKEVVIEKTFFVGQKVIWVHGETKVEKNVVVEKIKKKILINTSGEQLWVSPKNLFTPEELAKLKDAEEKAEQEAKKEELNTSLLRQVIEENMTPLIEELQSNVTALEETLDYERRDKEKLQNQLLEVNAWREELVKEIAELKEEKKKMYEEYQKDYKELAKAFIDLRESSVQKSSPLTRRAVQESAKLQQQAANPFSFQMTPDGSFVRVKPHNPNNLAEVQKFNAQEMDRLRGEIVSQDAKIVDEELNHEKMPFKTLSLEEIKKRLEDEIASHGVKTVNGEPLRTLSLEEAQKLNEQEMIRLQNEIASRDTKVVEQAQNYRENSFGFNSLAEVQKFNEQEIVRLQNEIASRDAKIIEQEQAYGDMKQKYATECGNSYREAAEKARMSKKLGACENTIEKMHGQIELMNSHQEMNMVEKLELENKLEKQEKNKIYLDADSLAAQKIREEEGQGFPTPPNIEIVDVHALQAKLIREAKEKYKDSTYVQVMKDTLRRREENELFQKEEEERAEQQALEAQAEFEAKLNKKKKKNKSEEKNKGEEGKKNKK